jgi:small-conductance mechanosensitive channel
VQILAWTVGGTPIRDWLIAIGATIGLWLLIHLIKRVIGGRLSTFAKRTLSQWDDVIVMLLNRTQVWFTLLIALYFGSQLVLLPPRVATPIRSAVILAFFIQIAIWGNGLITVWITRYKERMIQQDTAIATTVTALGYATRIVLWSAIGLVTLQNLGFKVDSLIAGLGVGGIAVALAVQNILGDLFASLSIVLDKPFLIGDFIAVDQLMGTVEHIGLKTTRVRSLTGEQLIFANGDLLKSRIRNYKRMQERRVVFSICLPFSTPADRLALVPEMLREIVATQPNVRFDRAHVKEVGPSSINVEVVYWVTDPDYLMFMNIQQAIILAVLRRFEQEGLQLAFPTQSLHFEGERNQ